MNKLLFILCILVASNIHAETNNSQSSSYIAPKKKQTSGFDKRRLLIGPGLGFGAGNRAFSFNISPSLGYALTDNFNVGTTLGFNYYQASENYINPITQANEVFKYKYPAYSFSLWARYLIGNYLIVNFEPEINNTKFVESYSFTNSGKIVEKSRRLMVPSVLVGAGYPQRIGNYGYSYFMVCYDLIQDPNARYYQTLDIRLGIMLNLWR